MRKLHLYTKYHAVGYASDVLSEEQQLDIVKSPIYQCMKKDTMCSNLKGGAARDAMQATELMVTNVLLSYISTIN